MTRIPLRNLQAGFSLIELAIVLVIVGLLVGGGIAALIATTEQTRRSEAKRQLEHVREALYGFAMSNGRLPCPDTNYPPDGEENLKQPSEDDCVEDGGALPWVDLGLGRRDPWGYPIYYHVDPDFADDDTNPTFDLDDPSSADLEVGDSVNSSGNLDGDRIAYTPAVVVSFGSQGGQVWTDGTYNCPASGFSDDENGNCDKDDIFVATEYRPPDANEGRFDDVIIWVPLPVLKSRMVDAGLLP